MTQTSSSDETVQFRKGAIFPRLPENMKIMQEAKSGVPDGNDKFHDTIPHITSKKTITLTKIFESYQIHLKHIFV